MYHVCKNIRGGPSRFGVIEILGSGDRVRIICARYRGGLQNFPLLGAPTRFRTRKVLRNIQPAIIRFRALLFATAAWGNGAEWFFNGNFFIYRAICTKLSGIFAASPSVLKM